MCTTFSDPPTIMESLHHIQDCNPAATIIVSLNTNVERIKQYCDAAGFVNIAVYGVSQLQKRRQMLVGLEHVKSEITMFIDDDVVIPSVNVPRHLLACFEDPKVGAAGPRQRVRRQEKPSWANFLGIGYLERRNFNTSATNAIDGGISTLSGRLQAIRTEILRNEEFYYYFRNDSFMGRPLMVDDDKALTRFIYSRNWQIKLNFSSECFIETDMDEGLKFIHQCVRWARGHWRGNLIVMLKESYWYKTHLWTLYTIYLAQFQTPAFLVDGLIFWLLHRSIIGSTILDYNLCMGTFIIWVMLTKTIKLMSHFSRHPKDVVYLPLALAFSYMHGLVNIYALCTTYKTTWGSKSTGPEQIILEDSYYPSDMPAMALRPHNNLFQAYVSVDTAHTLDEKMEGLLEPHRGIDSGYGSATDLINVANNTLSRKNVKATVSDVPTYPTFMAIY